MRLVCVVLLLLVPSLVGAQSHSPNLTIPTLVYVGAVSADLASTYRNLASGPDAREHNPLLGFTQNRPVPTVLAGAAFTGAGIWAWHRYVGRSHPQWARMGLYVAAGIHGFYATRNTIRYQRGHP